MSWYPSCSIGLNVFAATSAWTRGLGFAAGVVDGGDAVDSGPELLGGVVVVGPVALAFLEAFEPPIDVAPISVTSAMAAIAASRHPVAQGRRQHHHEARIGEPTS